MNDDLYESGHSRAGGRRTPMSWRSTKRKWREEAIEELLTRLEGSFVATPMFPSVEGPTDELFGAYYVRLDVGPTSLLIFRRGCKVNTGSKRYPEWHKPPRVEDMTIKDSRELKMRGRRVFVCELRGVREWTWLVDGIVSSVEAIVRRVKGENVLDWPTFMRPSDVQWCLSYHYVWVDVSDTTTVLVRLWTGGRCPPVADMDLVQRTMRVLLCDYREGRWTMDQECFTYMTLDRRS
jgi:hypothetical protein